MCYFKSQKENDNKRHWVMLFMCTLKLLPLNCTMSGAPKNIKLKFIYYPCLFLELHSVAKQFFKIPFLQAKAKFLPTYFFQIFQLNF